MKLAFSEFGFCQLDLLVEMAENIYSLSSLIDDALIHLTTLLSRRCSFWTGSTIQHGSKQLQRDEHDMPNEKDKLRAIDEFAEKLWKLLNTRNYQRAAASAAAFVKRHTGGKAAIQLYMGNPKDISSTMDAQNEAYWGRFPSEHDSLGLDQQRDLSACQSFLRQLPPFALERGLLPSEHMEEMRKILWRYRVLRGLAPDDPATKDGPVAPQSGPGRPPDSRIGKRNRLIRKIYRKMMDKRDWVELALRVNQSGEFAKLRLPKINRNIARKACTPSNKRRPNSSNYGDGQA